MNQLINQCKTTMFEINKNKLEGDKIEKLIEKIKEPNFTIKDAEIIFNEFCSELLKLYQVNLKQEEIQYFEYLRRVDFFKIRYENLLK